MPDLNTNKLEKLDYKISKWMYKYGKPLLRYSLAITFFWFGYLKVIDASPAQELVARTVFWFDSDIFIVVLGVWEMLIGLFLCFKPLLRIAILLLFLQMPGTFLPLILFPEVCFENFPLELTMEGQYIIKNLILISAAIVVGGTLRESELVEKNVKSADSQ
ncbi:hypothetical protein ACKGJN_12890 [Gillisia sp. Q332]|uniref:hypothetical protein n=1 Tax=Gillisia xinjiangensis TaxID=3384765 RepID=UPI00391CB645